jgi:hypothetical protein
VLAAGPAGAIEPAGIADGPFVRAEGHLSLLSEAGDTGRRLTRAFGGAVEAGWRWDGWGAFLDVSPNFWLSSEDEGGETQGVLDLGLGGEALYGGGLLHTTVAAGASILLLETFIDEPGQVGFYLDVHPVGLRWQVGDGHVLGLDPLSLAVQAPALDGIPLLEVQYRTSLTWEIAP